MNCQMKYDGKKIGTETVIDQHKSNKWINMCVFAGRKRDTIWSNDGGKKYVYIYEVVWLNPTLPYKYTIVE